jgi:hypothetical protein
MNIVKERSVTGENPGTEITVEVLRESLVRACVVMVVGKA